MVTIESQDGTVVGEYKQYFRMGKNIYGFVGSEDQKTELGMYESEERAKEVLNEIINHIINQRGEYLSHLAGFQTVNRGFIVFRMPEK